MEPQVSHPKLPMILAIGITAIIFGLGGYLIASMANNDATTDTTVTTGSTSTATTTSSTSPTTKATATTSSSTDNIFEATKVKVGDKVAGMTITSIAPFRSTDTLSNDSAKIQFSGQTTISGTITNTANETLGCLDIMDLDTSSKSSLPQLLGDDRNGLCLTGNLGSTEFPVGTKWKATIVIDNYLISMAGTEVRNSAKLISVTTKTKL